MILNIQNEYKGVDLINLAYDRVKWQSLVNSTNGRMSLVAQCSVQGHFVSIHTSVLPASTMLLAQYC